MKTLRDISLLYLFVLLLVPTDSIAQYFGRNKPRYSTFQFRVLQSPHFELYHYLDDTLAEQYLSMAERWYEIHQRSFTDTIRFRNPLIIYNNHADFQQTTTIRSLIGIETGGVTEALKNRVVMPVTDSWKQTDHVLGHELVHAFQYNLLNDSNDTLDLSHLSNVPLWMVEGLAEYLSLGQNDPNTAMWMRDAVMQDDIPSLKDLTTSNKYFPYRYGQAFWAFVGGTWGDDIAILLYKNTLRYGMKTGFLRTLGMEPDSVSVLWRNEIFRHYSQYMRDSTDRITGELLAGPESMGRININPSVSPNGKYVIFFSSRDLFTVDLYLADLETGKILKKISSIKHGYQHLDDVHYMESTGTWSPDGRKYAYVAVDGGRNKLAIVDVWRTKLVELIEVPGIPSISNPSWSPWGDRIAFTGKVGGISDIYVYHLATDLVESLTNDPYSDLHPSWSLDGRRIVYSTDRISLQKDQGQYSFNLAIIDTEQGTISDHQVFQGSDNLNPQFVSLNEVLFVSDVDGFRNLYMYDPTNQSVFRLTKYFTGISSITSFAPSFSTSPENQKVVYTYYAAGKYRLYKSDLDEFEKTLEGNLYYEPGPGILPPFSSDPKSSIVSESLSDITQYAYVPEDSLHQVNYKPKFKLDYVGGGMGAGIGYNSFGVGMAGSVNLLFGDILGNNMLYTGLAVNGEVYDFGGQLAYLNQKRRIGWGVSLSHIPYRYDYGGYLIEELQVAPDSTITVLNYAHEIFRIFEDQAGVFGYYPFSRTHRIEFSGSYSRYSYRIDRINNYYYDYWYIGYKKEQLDAPDPYGLVRANTALVGDNSYFGVAAPLKGHRFRYDYTQYGGFLNFYSLLFDHRRYIYIKPVSLAVRAYYYGRLGSDRHSMSLSPMYLGYPTLIRGYNGTYVGISYEQGKAPVQVEDIYGNQLIVGNIEIRIPLSGPESLAMIKSKIFFTDLNFFVDMGTIWDLSPVYLSIGEQTAASNSRRLLVSTGASVRINLFGQLVLEPYYAYPLQRADLTDRKGVFGVNFLPGW